MIKNLTEVARLVWNVENRGRIPLLSNLGKLEHFTLKVIGRNLLSKEF
jgi:hypothetical protein